MNRLAPNTLCLDELTPGNSYPSGKGDPQWIEREPGLRKVPASVPCTAHLKKGSQMVKDVKDHCHQRTVDRHGRGRRQLHFSFPMGRGTLLEKNVCFAWCSDRDLSVGCARVSVHKGGIPKSVQHVTFEAVFVCCVPQLWVKGG